MRARLAFLIALASCGDNVPMPDASLVFDYRATLGWYAPDQPYILSVTIDGADLQSGVQYVFEHSYASYDDALATFTRRVVANTTTGVQELELVPAQCSGAVRPGWLERPILSEEDEFGLQPVYMDPTRLIIGADCGKCTAQNLTIAWCSRVGAH